MPVADFAGNHQTLFIIFDGATRFAYIGIGSTLKALQFDVENSRRFMSPVYEIMIDFVGRILDQNPELYASIQSNPQAASVRQTFLSQCMMLCEKADCGDMEGFKQMMMQAAEHYGETHQALERSDRVINARIGEREEKKADR